VSGGCAHVFILLPLSLLAEVGVTRSGLRHCQQTVGRLDGPREHLALRHDDVYRVIVDIIIGVGLRSARCDHACGVCRSVTRTTRRYKIMFAC